MIPEVEVGMTEPLTTKGPDALTESVHHVYDEAYFRARQSGVDPLRAQMYRQELARLAPMIPARGRVLDIGCGTGDFLRLLPDGWELYGTEISEFARNIAREHGVVFEVPDEADSFDLVVFRGTIQHIDEPLSTVKWARRLLRPGGLIAFLATPNAGSICYRMFQDLPALVPELNFVVFSDRELRNTLTNLGFEDLRFEYPYLGTPYAHLPADLLRFVGRCLGIRSKFAFWGNMMECYARKPGAAGGRA